MREDDHKNEQIFHLWLIKNFYTHLAVFKSASREENINGIDGTFNLESGEVTVDEKLYLSKTGKPLSGTDTQCFELMFRMRPDYVQMAAGWYFTGKAQVYVLSRITEYGGDYKYGDILEPVKIKKARIIYISKQRIKDLFRDYDFDSHDLMVSLSQLITGGHTRSRVENGKELYYVDISDTMYLCWSKHLQEEPINLIISWKILEEYAEYVFDAENKGGVTVCRTRKNLQDT